MINKIYKNITILLLLITLIFSFGTTIYVQNSAYAQTSSNTNVVEESDSFYPATALDPNRPERAKIREYYEAMESSAKFLDKLDKAEERNKFLEKELKDNKNVSTMISGMGASLVNIIEDPQNVDYLNEYYNVLNVTLNYAFSAIPPPYGGIASGALDIFNSFVSMGEDASSELELLEGRLNTQFDEVKDELAIIKNDINGISKELSDSTSAIINKIDKSFESHVANERLTEFTSSGVGNFDYYQFKNYIYGSTDASINPNGYRQAYASKLEEMPFNSSMDEMKEYYDALYRSLESSANGKSNVSMFYDYLLYDKTKIQAQKPIIYYYYEYLLSNEKVLDGSNAEVLAINFLHDLFLTAEKLNQLIDKCNSYQILWLLREKGSNLKPTDKYYFGDEYITYEDILKSSTAIATREELLFKQMIIDVSYLLNMSGSFTVNDNGNLRNVNHSSDETFGFVNVNDYIYMNKLPEFVNVLFNLDEKNFTFKWFSNNKLIAENDGVLKVTSTYGSFMGALYYNDVKLYEIDFSLSNPNVFHGGNGTKEDPYQISNANQFMLIYNDEYRYEKHYELVNDINLNGITISPLCEIDYNSFDGTFNGNGHKIYNFKVSSNEIGGLFGYIGNGTVSNLVLADMEVNVTNNDKTDLNAGAFAGECAGNINNCKTDNVKITINRSSNKSNSNLNKAIYAYAGGIVGELSGSINACACQNTVIEIESERDYKTDSDSANKQFAYAGGITAVALNGAKITNCYVDSLTKINCHVKSVTHQGMSTRKPTIKAYTGGIAGECYDNSFTNNVFSAIDTNNINVNIEVKNASWVGGSNKDNCEQKVDAYVGEIKSTTNFVKAESLNDVDFGTFGNLDISYEFNTLRNKDYGYCFEGQLYESGEEKLKTENLLIMVNGTPLNYDIESYYNFDTINTQTQFVVKQVILLISFSYGNNNYYQLLNLPITIKEDKPCGIEIEVPDYVEKEEYNNNKYVAYKNTDEFLSKNEKVYLLMNSGAKTEIDTSLVQNNYESSKRGVQSVELSYNGFTANYNVLVSCTHKYNANVVAPTCVHIGYTRYVCEWCGNAYRDVPVAKLNHVKVVKNAKEPSCTEVGYTGDLGCENCDTIFQKGEEIAKEPHVYKHIKNDNKSHWCENCSAYEEHHITSIENTNGKIIYYCATETCNYVSEGVADLTKIPRVIVSDGYVLEGGGLVEIKVQILNNPGLTGASCAIVYDPRLELVSYKQGNILNPANYVPSEIRDGLVSFTIYDANGDSDNSNGNLLILVFEVPKVVANLKEEFEISVTHTNSNVTFADIDNQPIDILAIPGVITVVDHLPGDVNNDGFVDLLDTVLISLYFNNVNGYNEEINQTLLEAGFNEFYADVDLNGVVNVNDVIEFVRYMAGGYDSQILNNSFKITLNPNDGTSNLQIIEVECFDENGNRNKYNNLPVLERDGYRFLGWYTRANLTDEGCKKVENGVDIYYDVAQYKSTHKQILYAHWELNEVSFDVNGAISGDIDSATFNNTGENLILNYVPEKEVTVTYYYNNNGVNEQVGAETVTFEFLGWATKPDGDVVYNIGDVINLKLSNNNIGKLTLYAVWSEEYVTLINYEKFGKEFLGWVNGSSTLQAGSQLQVASSVQLYAHFDNIIYTVKFDGNGATEGEMDLITNINSGEGFTVPNSLYKKVGHTFSHWSINPNDDPNDNPDKDADKRYDVKDKVYYIPTNQNGVATLYAIYKPVTYSIKYENNTPSYLSYSTTGAVNVDSFIYNENVVITENVYALQGYNFKGWALEKSPSVDDTLYTANSVITNNYLYNYVVKEGEALVVKLYAVWEVNVETIGKCDGIANGAVVSDSYNNGKTYTVYKTIASTPRTTNLFSDRVIIDWSTETNLDISAHGVADHVGRTDHIDIGNNVKELVLVGESSKTFKNLQIVFCEFTNNHTINLRLFNFNLESNYNNTFECYNTNGIDEGINLVVETNGDCKFSKVEHTYTGNVFDGMDYLTFKGTGNLTLQGGNADNANNNGGSCIVNSNTVTVDMEGSLTIKGGNGGAGISAGGNGSNGGVAVSCTNFNVLKVNKLTVEGGSGGKGIAGSNGADGSGNDSPGSAGNNGGNGGNGASAIVCTNITISTSCPVYLAAGDGGAGGKGGNGGNGTRDNAPWSNGNNKGGKGGNGGNGGSCEAPLISTNATINSSITYDYGTVGAGGVGGNGGNGGPGNTAPFPLVGGPGGDGGSGGTGGLNGDGVTRAANGANGQQG